MTESLRKFVRDHLEDDLSELLLHASRYRDVDMETAVIQLKARRRIKEKLPTWYRDDRLIFPSSLAAEQCSSEITALYKQRLVKSNDRVCDLTGGLGVDTCSFAQKAMHVVYIEREPAYCTVARYNFDILGVTAVDTVHGDAIEMIENSDVRIAGADVFYMDPARRGVGNKRLYALSDCEPDLIKMIALLPKPYRMIVKLSPMLDISQVLNQIPNVREVHVVSVKNECKELLITVESMPEMTFDSASYPLIFCVNYPTEGTEHSFRFCMQDERGAIVPFAKRLGRYLYEPNASVLKAGAYKSIAIQYDVGKLHASSHLYTSDQLINSFPGRVFEIKELIPFSSRTCKRLQAALPKANMAVRNFPLSADELRKRTGIADGGSVYLFATTLANSAKTLIKCSKIEPLKYL